jgi:hydroxymethylbilane synthase
MNPLRIGTRGSPLALWQAHHVRQLLEPLTAPRTVQLVIIQTSGDVVTDVPLTQIGGDGVFTREIQRALLADQVDVAVHSLKDLPTTVVSGLMLAAVPPRGPTGDVFVSSRHARFEALPPGATVATSSLRRRSQALFRRPDLRLVNVRGNVGTRLRKLDEEGLDALILAQAGLERLGLSARVTEVLDPTWMLPAVGQGALGLECRAADTTTRNLLHSLDDATTHAAVQAERAMLRGLGGGCQVPIGAATLVTGDRLTLRGVVLAPDGTSRISDFLEGSTDAAENLGRDLAQRLLSQGARELL